MPAYADIIATDAAEDSAAQVFNKANILRKDPVEVVVSGMAGRFPESSSVAEFERNLYEGVDMITEDDRRWTPGLYGLPSRSGKLPQLSHFDAPFFSVSPRQAHCMDPQLRLLLEVAHEAIFDAGLHPSTLKGRRVGVYVGVSGSETEEFITEDPEKITGYELTGCCRAMFANRLSYALDLKGPSFAVDTACSSALVALSTAFSALQQGQIEAAIVAGSSLTLKPQSSLQFHTLSMLSPDGSCKAFDARANGYVRSEAVTAVLLQRQKDAIRVYGHLVEALSNTDGHKGEGITFPSGEVQKQLLQEVYQKAGVDPTKVSYVEAHGTGTKAGDPQELGAISEIFCKGRTDALLIGSVKSNMGHSEPASGLCAMIKVLLAMQKEELPGNLHFQSPNPDIPALNDGRIKVVSENTPWRGQYAGINCFGFGGANVHVLLRSPELPHHDLLLESLKEETMLTKGKDASIIPEGDTPRLVVIMGRTEEHATQVLEEFQRNRNKNFAHLLDNIAEVESSPVAFPFRGYTIVGGINDHSILNVSSCSTERTPLWLVFSGMGSQWTGCGTALLELPPFLDVLQRCRSALLPLGVDVIDIVTREEPDPMASTTASFTAIAAMQVGLMEVLKSVGLTKFDGFVGHSVGELGCGYADGTLTPEQTVLCAYWRGRAIEEANLPLGKMAAVGLGAEDAQKWIGKDSNVVVACRNSATSVTISGPKDEVELLQEKFEAEGIFCKSVNSGGIAFHHSNLRLAAPRLLSELQKVILTPMKRSPRWISSSIPESKWSSGVAQKASPEYLVNNLVSPVLFDEALKKIPDGARVLEVSPHALMQAVLRRALPSCIMFPLIRKESKDVVSHLLDNIGKLYASGENVNLKSLYEDPTFPVPPGTPSIGSLVRWEHSTEFDVAKFTGYSSKAEFKVEVNLNDPNMAYLEGHNIDGRVLFPATGYMTLAWKALAKMVQKRWDELPVTFSDVTLHQATVLNANNSGVIFTVRVLLSTGEFEVLAGDTVAVSGKIHVGVKETPESVALNCLLTKAPQEEGDIELSHRDVYKELRLRGYRYGGDFKGIVKSDMHGTEGKLEWKDNWVSLLDTLLQFSLLGSPLRGLYLPTRIRRVHLQPEKFYKVLNNKSEKTVQVNHSRNLGITTCPGIEIHGLKASMAPRKAPSDTPMLDGYKFYPNHLEPKHKISGTLTFESSIRLLMDLVLENTPALKIRIGHLVGQTVPMEESAKLALNMLEVMDCHPLLSSDYVICHTGGATKAEIEDLNNKGINAADTLDVGMVSKLNLLVLSQCQMEVEDLSLVASLGCHAFILVRNETLDKDLVGVGLVEVASIQKFNLHLLRKPNFEHQAETLKIDSSDEGFSWVHTLKERVLQGNPKSDLWLISSGTTLDGLLGMTKCLRREPGGERIRCVVDPDNLIGKTPSLWHQVTTTDLAYNIFQSGTWGTMRHLPLTSTALCPSEYAYLNVLTRGDLSSLTWLLALPPVAEPGEDRLPCSVNYAPLNFRDIMLASGKLPPDALPGSLAQKECILGLEFAGQTEEGTRVMGLIAAGGLASSVLADPHLTWKVPEEWTLRQAATVPVVYATAYYALVVRGGLESGESVLIHAGSGGVGQAAISIALARGCTVFTTVSSEKKRNYLKERFPQLADRNFANSRDSTFEFHLLEQTKGQGVDLVLNSLAGELLQASVRCLKEHGRFLEIGKADLASNTALGMAVFLKNVTFHGILLDALFEGSVERKKALQKVVYDGIASGEVQPLSFTTYKFNETEDAFRFMASGKHIGKVLLEVAPEGTPKPSRKPKRKNNNNSRAQGDMPQEIPEQEGIPCVFKFWPKPQSVYVITGGLGGLGLELADWLLGRGAKHLVLTSRRGVSTGYQALCMKRWKASGADVRVLKQDASSSEGAEKLLTEAATRGPVGGIFHLAMILEDSVLENQSPEKFELVSRVKADGAKHMDMASRKLCPDLHIWVTFSSVACGTGNAGQSNYGWANSVSERVVEDRVAAGLPGCAIQWGGISDVGVLADTLGDVEVAGTKPQSLRSVLGCLDRLLGSDFPVVCSVCLASKKSSGRDGKGAKSLVASLANILGIRDISKVPQNVSLGDLGMDSLMAVEIKQTLEREADVIMATEQIRELTLARVQEIETSETSQQSGGDMSTASTSSTTEIVTEMPFSWLDFPLVPSDILRPLTSDAMISKGSSAPLFLASPIQGTCDILSQVAHQIGTRVIGLQYPCELPSTSIPKLAEAVMQKIEKFLPEGPFYLGGYSFGASVAFEMASQLEQKGRRPLALVLLDGSQSYVSGIIGTYQSKYVWSQNAGTPSEDDTQAQGESEALVTYALQLCPVDAAVLRPSLLRCESFTQRLDLLAETLTQKFGSISETQTSPSPEEIKLSASLFFDRLVAGFNSLPSANISLDTLLVRAAQNNYLAKFGQDYGLSKVVKSSLTVREVPGTHESFICGNSASTVAHHINEFLQLPTQNSSQVN